MSNSQKSKSELVKEIQQDASLTNSQRMTLIRQIMGQSGPTVTRSIAKFPPKEEPSFRTIQNTVLGCKHYQRNCKVQAPCCLEWIPCRLCHNQVMDHEVDRRAIKLMFCMLCKTEQTIQQHCSNCSEKMGEYFCSVCNLVDSTPGKDIFHCDKCGICRVGKVEDYFHCDTCCVCFRKGLDNHSCKSDILGQNCPICAQGLFASVKQVRFLPCGHPMHSKCFKGLIKQLQPGEPLIILRCPLCQKCISEEQLKMHAEIVDVAISQHAVPEEYKKEVAIYCVECDKRGKTNFHFYGLKCPECNCYNTSRIDEPPVEEEIQNIEVPTSYQEKE